MSKEVAVSSSVRRRKNRQVATVGSPAPKRDGNPFLDFLDKLSTGQFAAAGVAEEVIRREKGFRARPFGKAIKKTVREKRSFGELTGNPITGFGLDVLIDPVNLAGVQLGGGRGTLVPFLAKAARLPKALKVADEATDSIKAIRKLKEGIVKLAPESKQIERANSKEAAKLWRNYVNNVEGGAPIIRDEVEQVLTNLVPDPQTRIQLTDMVEKAGRQQGGIPFQQLDIQRLNLTPDERKFVETSQVLLSELEEMKQGLDLVSAERAAGFVESAGMPYLPRLQATRDFAIQRLDEVIQAKVKKDPAVAHIPNSVDDLKAWKKQLQETEELLKPSDRAQLDNYYKQGNFERVRDTKGLTQDELADLNKVLIERDMAKAIGIQSAEVAKLRARDEFVNGMKKMLEDEGALLDAGEDIISQARTRIGGKQAVKRLREGFVAVENVPEFKGKLVPKSLKPFIERAAELQTKDKAMNEFFRIFSKVQNIWKAHTLAVFPAYHSRNIISNLNNNYLAGMGLDSLQDYRTALDLMTQAKTGKLSTQKTFRFGNKTYSGKELVNLAKANRVLDGGETIAEMVSATRAQLDPRRWATNILDPSKNPATRAGFTFGRTMENHSRFSHFIWKMRKTGGNIDEAAESVQKFMFDYTHGLPPLIDKFGRNFATPFIAWTYFNLPLQLEMLVRRPHVFTRFGKFKRNVENEFGGPEPNEVFLQDYLKRGLSVRVGYNKAKDTYEYFLFDSWWPGAELNKLFSGAELGEEVIGQISPFLKVVPELAANYNLWQSRKISEFPGQKKKILKVPLPARMEHMVRQIRFLNETDRVIDAMERAEGLQGAQRWLPAVTRLMAGRVYPQDFNKQKQWMTWSHNIRLSKLKTRRKKEQRKGNLRNVQTLDRLIQEAEERKKEFK